jgi:hypothetical protein
MTSSSSGMGGKLATAAISADESRSPTKTSRKVGRLSKVNAIPSWLQVQYPCVLSTVAAAWACQNDMFTFVGEGGKSPLLDIIVTVLTDVYPGRRITMDKHDVLYVKVSTCSFCSSHDAHDFNPVSRRDCELPKHVPDAGAAGRQGCYQGCCGTSCAFKHRHSGAPPDTHYQGVRAQFISREPEGFLPDEGSHSKERAEGMRVSKSVLPVIVLTFSV